MRESLICIGRVAEIPYRFSDTGVCVYSYEELVYYMKGHLILYLYTLPGKDLTMWIRDELRLEKLYRALDRLEDPGKDQMKYFAALFREGNYYTEEEIRGILDEYRVLKTASRFSQCKWVGHLFYSENHADVAILHYREALKEEGVTEGDLGAVHHNLACALTRLFRFRDARIHFLKAYQYGGDERSLYLYYAIIALTEGVARAREELSSLDISDLILESFETRYSRMRDGFQWTDQAAVYRKLHRLSSEGREEDRIRIQNRFVRTMQRDFRSQIGRPDQLYVANPPAKYASES